MNAPYGGWTRRIALSGSLAAGLFAGLGPARADPAPSFAELVSRDATAPRLLESEADILRAQGLAEQARARLNPSISLLAENFAGTSSPYRGLSAVETTLQYNQPIERGGKRAARIAAGEAGVAASRARRLALRVDYAYELARAYGDAEVSELRVVLVRDEIVQANEDLRIARALVAAGKEARLRSLQAQSGVDVLAADLAFAQATRTAAFARLSAIAGAQAPYTSLAESLLQRPAPPLAAAFPDPLTSPAYRAALADRRAAELRVTAERRRTVPDITATGGIRRLERENAFAAVAGVSLPLRLYDQNRGNVAAALADVQAADARLALTRYQAQAETQATGAQVVAADARVSAAQASFATAQEAYRLAGIAYTAGKSPLSELLLARRGLGAARGVVLDALAARLQVRARLAQLSGRTILGDPIQ